MIGNFVGILFFAYAALRLIPPEPGWFSGALLGSVGVGLILKHRWAWIAALALSWLGFAVLVLVGFIFALWYDGGDLASITFELNEEVFRPSRWTAVIIVTVLAVLAYLPIGLLGTQRARREFARERLNDGAAAPSAEGGFAGAMGGLSRGVLRFLLRALVIPLIPIAIWLIVICIQFDEAPTAEAVRWGQPYEHKVADADNAWLYLLGIGAAENDDPIALGRRRVDTYEARIWRTPRPPADAAETALFNDPVPYRKPDLARDGADTLCPIRTTDCVTWAAQHGAMLERLVEGNRVLLRRYEQLLAMHQWNEVATVTVTEPIPDAGITNLYLNQLAYRIQSGEDARAVTARLVQVVTFWRRVAEQSQSLFSKRIAFTFIEYSQRLLDSIAGRSSPAQLRAIRGNTEVILAAPSAAQMNLEILAKWHFLFMDDALREAFPGFVVALRRCFAPAEVSCGQSTLNVLFGVAYLPQATRNDGARRATAMAQILAAPAAEQEAVFEANRSVLVSKQDLREGNELYGSYFSWGYNITGKIMQIVGQVEFLNDSRRIHDQEALRRMLVIKLDALQRKVPVGAMPDFLAAQPAALRDPYSGQPFGWDPDLKIITYTPAATKYWKRERLEFGYGPR